MAIPVLMPARDNQLKPASWGSGINRWKEVSERDILFSYETDKAY